VAAKVTLDLNPTANPVGVRESAVSRLKPVFRRRNDEVPAIDLTPSLAFVAQGTADGRAIAVLAAKKQRSIVIAGMSVEPLSGTSCK
jgi:hypothetical protein